VRRLITQAAPEIVEDRRWAKPSIPAGVAVWSQAGIVCTGEIYRQVVKLTFARGAALPDPRRLFNASLTGRMRRAIDLREGQRFDRRAFQALIRAAVAENTRASVPVKESPKRVAGRGAVAGKGVARRPLPAAGPGGVVLLSGGNPRIAKADGDAPVQAYIAAMPGWKRELGRRLDALIVQALPDVQKAVRWNSPFYGVPNRGWCLSFHVFAKYVKVTFFQGVLLQPLPPGGTPKSGDARWIDIAEDGPWDEAQLRSWVQQAAALPGWDLAPSSLSARK
jgi:hypothetical protein